MHFGANQMAWEGLGPIATIAAGFLIIIAGTWAIVRNWRTDRSNAYFGLFVFVVGGVMIGATIFGAIVSRGPHFWGTWPPPCNVVNHINGRC
jgi:hypothetical protein